MCPYSVNFRFNKEIDCTPISKSPGHNAISVKSEGEISLTETLYWLQPKTSMERIDPTKSCVLLSGFLIDYSKMQMIYWLQPKKSAEEAVWWKYQTKS
jgi:hypothetical protein